MGAAMKPMTLARYGLFAVTIVFSTMFAPTARADPYEDGFFAYHFSKDYVAALRIWLPLAEQGDAAVQTSVGGMYKEGRGTPQNYAEAARWYRKAAEQGDANAQYYLGGLYNMGRGVIQDPVAAHMWLNLAAANEDVFSRIAREERDRVAKGMTAAQIAEAQRLAREWTAKHGK